MGKASKWFRSLFGLKKPNTTPNNDAKHTQNPRWSFSKSTSKRYHITAPSIVPALPQFHSKGNADQQHQLKGNVNTAGFVKISCHENREYWVAVKIQSHFRAYLARKALRALKGLVKLQALVRGHIVRKQIAESLLQMQAALRARTRARALRSQINESYKPFHLNYPGPATPENSEHDIHRSRILQISTSSGEDQSLSPLKFTDDVDEASFAAETSLQFISTKTASFTRTGPYTPTRSNVSKSCHSGYSDYYPSYMSYTESSKAKLRSLSSPRQKTQLERSNTVQRFPVYNRYGNMKSSSTQNIASTLHSKFISKAYPGSGRLDRLGMPLGSNGVGFSGGLLSSF